MSYTNGLDKPTDYFNTKLYTGNGGAQSITGVGFQPDWVWLKRRDGSASHRLADSVRGTQKRLSSDSTNAESTETGLVTSFDSDGFTLNSSDVAFNGSSSTYVSWNWLAGGTASSNTDGSITSSVSANTTAGFSIVKFTGTGSVATVGHGLGVAPSFYVVKRIDGGDGGQWNCYHSSLGATKYILLNSTSASLTSGTRWNNTEPTSSVFTVNTSGDVNDSGDSHIAYCFAEKKGYSKFGSYTGNANTDGIFIYTGFRPAWVVFKNISTSNDWFTIDIKRDTLAPNNPVGRKSLNLNSSAGEVTRTTKDMDFVSNGIKLRTADGTQNNSGENYIFMAFAESPFVTSSGIPTTAR
tara:strand:- start:135 stop:1193 length:1059 start_codon:yes stop_codon:yes gene_type:complete